MDHKKYCGDSVTDRYNDNGNYSRFLAPSIRRATLVGDPTKIYTAEGKRERRERRRTTPSLSYSDIAYI